jgi:hypothetical protein
MRPESCRGSWSRSSWRRALPALLLLALAGAGCAGAQPEDPEVRVVKDREFPARPPGWPVRLYVTPALDHAERIAQGLGDGRVGLGPAGALLIGVFDVTAEGHGEPAPLERARTKAREIGGDAIVLLEIVSLTDPDDVDAEGRPMKGWRMMGKVLRLYP